MSLIIKNLYKSFQDINLFQDFNIEIQEHTIACILGPSGCGKTSLLNMISGSLQPDSGDLLGFNSKTISYIFQEPRLLPWKTVLENIVYVLPDSISKKEKHEIALRYSELVELTDFNNYYPSKLSGGMKQRVSIARAFSYPSDLILMDEPLKALDLKLKLNLMKSFRRLWQPDKRSVIFVTHDIDEALLIGNDIYVFSKAPVLIKEKFSIKNKDRLLPSPEIIQLKNRIVDVME
ncbi:MAG TPA: ABC transporter ATP-binding protein [Bacteroidales bacterium]|nr:ABC transporter ATP-binding protein [Bacteroidales bacterium]